MKTEQDIADAEKTIDSGILGVCILFVIIVNALAETLLGNDSGYRPIGPVIIFPLAFLLNSLLQRTRPKLQHAGSTLSKIYNFLLKEMDIGKVFKRK